jgi:hypothetical protein
MRKSPDMPAQRPYRLVARGRAGLACDEGGLALGLVDLVRLRLSPTGARHYEVRSAADVDQIMRVAYGPQSEAVVSRLHRGLCRAAAAIEAGDLGRAGVEAVKLRLPELAPEAMAKLGEITDLQKDGSPWKDEPRVPAGQTGGGQWTTDGAAAATGGKPIRNNASESVPSRAPRLKGPQRGAVGTARETPCDVAVSPDTTLLVPTSTAATAVNPYGWGDSMTLLEDALRLGRAGSLAAATALLDRSDIESARNQVANAITRFGLDPDRPADVIAASAYVWSNYNLPLYTAANWSGPDLEAASQAVMRLVMINPNAFLAMGQDSKASNAILTAANGALADYALESRARPPGVEPALQTTSSRARAAIADELKRGRMVAHHLVPAEVWGKNADIARLALAAGWNTEAPSNLIGLPYDDATREELGYSLPEHRGYHKIYNQQAMDMISYERSISPPEITPLRARAIMDKVASDMRTRIIGHIYDPIIKVC